MIISKSRRSTYRIIEDGLADDSIAQVFAADCKVTRQPCGGCVNSFRCRDLFGTPSEAAASVKQVNPVRLSALITKITLRCI
jgi:hypothetical protein